jgi:hypothetical protein
MNVYFSSPIVDTLHTERHIEYKIFAYNEMFGSNLFVSVMNTRKIAYTNSKRTLLETVCTPNRSLGHDLPALCIPCHSTPINRSHLHSVHTEWPTYNEIFITAHFYPIL